MHRQTLRQGLENGSPHPRYLRWMITLATLCICLVGFSDAIACHCLNNTQCSQADGSCPNGCEQGWHGPGCQIGNVAYRKPAFQSSTSMDRTADKAVDGVTPPRRNYWERETRCRFGDHFGCRNGSHFDIHLISHCSVTVSSNSYVPRWWFVSLSEAEEFVIMNITIVNTEGAGGAHLYDFYILYTSETIGHPNLTTWKHCTHQLKHQRGTIATYTCNNGTAIGRRVAVYLAEPDTIVRSLFLCEVIVNGYAYKETSMVRHTPVTVTPSCNSITVLLETLPVVPPTFLVVHMNASNGIHGSRVERIRNVGALSVTLLAMANVTYNISLAPETCCIGLMCLNDEAASIESSKCVVGPSTQPVSTETPQYQKYGLQNFGNFVSWTTLGSSQCRSTNFQIQCKGADSADGSFPCSTVSCTLDPRHNFTCTLQVIYSDGFVYTTTSNFTMDTERNEQNMSFTALDLAAASGGSATAVILTAALTFALILKHRKIRRASDGAGDVKKFTASSFSMGIYEECGVEEITYLSHDQDSSLQDENIYSDLCYTVYE